MPLFFKENTSQDLIDLDHLEMTTITSLNKQAFEENVLAIDDKKKEEEAINCNLCLSKFSNNRGFF